MPPSRHTHTFPPPAPPLDPAALQDKCEPPMYVSDRRFMKAIQMLQVAAHADGRDQVCFELLAWSELFAVVVGSVECT